MPPDAPFVSPEDQETFWALNDRYLALNGEEQQIEADYSAALSRLDEKRGQWQREMTAFNRAHYGQTVRLYRPGQEPAEAEREIPHDPRKVGR
jgi:hypothetical protein